MIPIQGLKPQLPYSNLIKSFAPDFKEIELLIESDHALGMVKNRLDNLRVRILSVLDAMSPVEFEIIAASHLLLYMVWLSSICYYGGGIRNSVAYISAAKYN